MPYQTGNGPSIQDVFYSPDVYINNVPAALWLKPIPSPAIAFPESVRVALSLPEIQSLNSSTVLASHDVNAIEVGLGNKGEVPQEGTPGTVTPETALGDATTSSGSIFVDLSRNIDLCLSDAKNGAWKETGNNTRILACYSSVGFNIPNDQTPWCAAFAGSLMKKVGVASLKTLSSLAYKGFGTAVPLGDPSKYRLNDIVVFSRQGGGHIGFFRGYNPTTGSVLIAGGNQSDNLTETGFKAGGMPIISVSRAWNVPAEYDKPVTYSGGASSSVKVV